MIRTISAIAIALTSLMAPNLTPGAQAAEARLASPVYTKILSTRFNYIRSTNESAPANVMYLAQDYRDVTPLARSIGCPLTSCGLSIDVDLSAAAALAALGEFDSIYLCVYVDGVRKDCSWNAIGQRITGARLNTFVPLAKGTHAIQIKGKSYNRDWSVFQAIAHYTLLGP